MDAKAVGSDAPLVAHLSRTPEALPYRETSRTFPSESRIGVRRAIAEDARASLTTGASASHDLIDIGESFSMCHEVGSCFSREAKHDPFA